MDAEDMTIGVVVISALWHIPGARTLINPLKACVFHLYTMAPRIKSVVSVVYDRMA
jgi:hypothetical protein